MNLFNHETTNILPYDGTAIYFGKIFTEQVANFYFESLLKTISWKNDEALIYGKHYITARKVAWYGNDNYAYTYSNTTKQAEPFTKDLLTLKSKVEESSQVIFNSCLLNLYHNGEESMAYHSDDENSLGENTVIASLSFGAERKFSFKHKRSGETISISLEHGSFLLMKDATQTHWLHSLPKSKKITSPRINLTFRTFYK
jgi:alkylated DNA repair dioxygenase AlkB